MSARKKSSDQFELIRVGDNDEDRAKRRDSKVLKDLRSKNTKPHSVTFAENITQSFNSTSDSIGIPISCNKHARVELKSHGEDGVFIQV